MRKAVVVIRQELMPGVPEAQRRFVVDEVRKGIVYGHWLDTGDFDTFEESDIGYLETMRYWHGQ